MIYKLIRETRKTLVIKIQDNGEIIVKAPKKCSIAFINNFIHQKQNWIEKRIELVKEKNIIYQDFFALNKVMLFGTEYSVFDFGNHYTVSDYYIKHTKSSNKLKVLKAFYTKLANQYILARCEKFANELNLKYKNASIISARKKWGSCNNLKHLKFNFRLIMLPYRLIDYVICHELCHTKQLNHSKEFWRLLSQLGFNKNEIKKEFEPYNFTLSLL